MHFDDRLSTVLRLPPSGDAMAAVQFRQLVDILGGSPALPPSDIVMAAFERLSELERIVPAADRARFLRQPSQRICNPGVMETLVQAEPDVASAAIAAAHLSDADWLALIPRLPVRARGILRHRRDLSAPVAQLLEQLGVHDRALPSGPPDPLPEDPIPEPPASRFRRPTGSIAADQDISDDVFDLLDMANDPPPPTSLSEWARARAAQQQQQRFTELRDLRFKAAPEPVPTAREAGIGAIVRRIEEFRKARDSRTPVEPSADSPRLPLGDTVAAPRRIAQALDFSTDTQGRIDWVDGPDAPSLVGFALIDHEDPALSHVTATMRQMLPLQGAHIHIHGAAVIAGEWQADAIPRFRDGRFAGYVGRLRRPAPPATPHLRQNSRDAEADRMREVLHELRTPANAIQVAAEIIQQQLYGPAPHEYRALAAAIAGDCAHILAGFEELDRLVKLETGAMTLEAGECDIARILSQTIARLGAWTEPRASGFAMRSSLPSSLMAGVARAEAERLVWRLFAALAGSTAPGEMLELGWTHRGAMIELSVALPALLAEREADRLFDTVAIDRSQSFATGMFGVGFTLRLADAEATAAGGSLRRKGERLHLYLPALTAYDAHNSTSATIAR